MDEQCLEKGEDLKRIVSGIFLMLLLSGMFTLAFNIQPAKSDYTWSETIYIRADGSVEPADAPISTGDNVTYTLTDNIVGYILDDTSAIIIERNNIVLDGAGHTLEGAQAYESVGLSLSGRSNVTIKSITIKQFYSGVCLENSSNNILSGSNITNNEGTGGILLVNSSNNTICGNRIADNYKYYGIFFYESSNNIIYRNNITNNSQYNVYSELSDNNKFYHNNFIQRRSNILWQVYLILSTNVWDDGYPSGGNYWNDYTGGDLYSGPYQNETGSDGIGDTPYVIYENNIDHYPLMSPWHPYINATVDVCPQILNLGIRAKWVTAYIELPEGYDIADIDVSSIMLNDTIPVEVESAVIGDYDNDGVMDLMVNFSRAAICYSVLSQGIMTGNVTLTVSGKLYNGTTFIGNDTIRVRMPGDLNIDGKVDMKDIVIVSKAFGTYPTHPRWNPIADENEDGKIDMWDVALICRNFGKTYT